MSGQEKKDRGKRKRKKEKGRREKRKGGEKRKRRGWKGTPAKRKNRRRVAARCQGVGKQNCQGEPGETLGFEVRWAWAGFGLLSRSLKIFYFAN